VLVRAAVSLVLLVASACAGPAQSVVPQKAVTAREPGDEPLPRHPDGVVFDLDTALPAVRIEAPAKGVVVLREPISREEALLVLHGYLRAFVSGDGAALSGIVLHDARRLDDTGGDLLQNLASRMRGVDYSHVSPESVAAFEDVRVMSYSDLSGSAKAPVVGVVAEELRRPDPMRDGDVVCEMPMRTRRVSGVRLFGERVVFLVRRVADGSLKIAGLAEEGAPWQ
jgi:hypothetical protein